MQFLRTALVSALVGVSMASFAAVSNTPAADPDAREARMQEALQHYYAKQETMNQGGTGHAKAMHHAKHRHHHAMKHGDTKPQDDSSATTSKDKDKDKTQ
jgi:phage I-like protein